MSSLEKILETNQIPLVIREAKWEPTKRFIITKVERDNEKKLAHVYGLFFYNVATTFGSCYLPSFEGDFEVVEDDTKIYLGIEKRSRRPYHRRTS